MKEGSKEGMNECRNDSMNDSKNDDSWQSTPHAVSPGLHIQVLASLAFATPATPFENLPKTDSSEEMAD